MVVPDPFRLLVITGSPDDAYRAEQALRGGGIPTETAHYRQFDEALDVLQQESFDLILLDPGRKPDIVEEVNDKAPGIPVILLISRGDLDVVVGALWHGADDYLVRADFTPGRLVCAVRYAVMARNLEVALGNADRLWRGIGRSLHEGVLVVERGGTVIFASARMTEILGCAPGSMQGLSFLSFVDPGDVPRAKALIDRDEGGRIDVEFRLRRSDGTVIDARLAASPVVGGSAGYPGVAVAVMDITEQKLAEARARGRNAQLSVINQVVRAATSSADLDEMLAVILKKTLDFLDFEGGGIYLIGPGRFRAERVAEVGLSKGFLFRRIVDMDAPPYDTVLGRGVAYFVEDYPRCYPQDAETGILAFASIPIVAGGRVIGAVNLVSRNAHVFSPDERELLTSIGRGVGSAVERMRLHEQANFYLDLMTHDINNANTAALGYFTLLAETLSGPEKDLAGKLAVAVRQSAEIIGNVSAIRRIAEEIPMSRPTALDPVVEGVINLFPDVDICYVPQNRWVAVDDLLPAVFINLVGNAIKFGGPGVSIRITTREEEGAVVVSVEDTGPGIPDVEKPRVFEKFRKSGTKSGKGLGLYIVRTLIERYGGRVWVEDRASGHPACGAVFRFTLPACPPITGRNG